LSPARGRADLGRTINDVFPVAPVLKQSMALVSQAVCSIVGDMASILRATTAGFRRSGRVVAARLGREEQAREAMGRVREARAAFDVHARRELRDEHAMQMVLATALREDSTAIDVGANEGAVLESIVRIAPRGRHVAFEPIAQLHDVLAARFPDVDVRCSAVSNEAGTAEFTHVPDAPAYSGLLQRDDLPAGTRPVERVSVRTERLDDVLAQGPVPTLIKIDVEGAELGVLQGAIETLQRHRPFVLFEHGAGGADLYGTQPTQVFDLLDGAGLRIFDLDGGGPYSRERFETTFTEPIWNFLAAPLATS
jgi:FkbM family methyltransferase